jgi:hypothetical protein
MPEIIAGFPENRLIKSVIGIRAWWPEIHEREKTERQIQPTNLHHCKIGRSMLTSKTGDRAEGRRRLPRQAKRRTCGSVPFDQGDE